MQRKRVTVAEVKNDDTNEQKKLQKLDNYIEKFHFSIASKFAEINTQASALEKKIDDYLSQKENKNAIKGLFADRKAKNALVLKFKSHLYNPADPLALTEKEHKLIAQHKNLTLKTLYTEMSDFSQLIESNMNWVELKFATELGNIRIEMAREPEKTGLYYNALKKVYEGLGKAFREPILKVLKDVHEQLKQDLTESANTAKPVVRQPR